MTYIPEPGNCPPPCERQIRIECVVICCNYGDFLSHTLPHNKQYFDKMVVVTDTKDLQTKNLCDFYDVHCVQTDIFYENGEKFNKAKGINEGLKVLEKSDWVVHMDADIFLPALTRSILQHACLDEQYIYGIDRMMCQSYEKWVQYIENPVLPHSGHIYVHPNLFPMGVRIAQYKTDGYIPIGFFQMWNPVKSGIHSYPCEHDSAARTDMQFAKQFPRNKRGLIPEIIAIHLESESGHEMGKNWNGRKTKLFTSTETNEMHYKRLLDARNI